MGRTLASRIRTEEQFKTLLTTLSLDLGRVSDYLWLFKTLVEAQREYWRGMSQSPAFWSTVMGALHDAGFHGLARAYDLKDDALTLRTLLETIESSPSFLSRPANFDQPQLQKDLEFVHHDTNEAVAHLMLWRHKFFAHRDAGKILKGWTLAEDAPLTNADITALVENGFGILNRYGYIFFNTETARHVHGHMDYLRVLETLQRDAEARQAKFTEQLQRAEAEAATEKPGTSGTDGT